MGVALPFFLFGLIALAIPIIMHLWSKNTKKSIPFGSIRFLRETETKTMKSIMPSQWLLLLTRLFLLSLLVLLLAEPFLNKEPKFYDTVFLVDTKYSELPWFTEWKDTLSENDDAFWLSNDFPPIEEQAAKLERDYWNLLSNPPKVKAEKVVVISPLFLTDFQSRRESFPIHYEWIKFPTSPIVKSDFNYEKGGQSYSLKTTFDEWSITHEVSAAENAKPIVVSYFMKVGEPYENYERIFRSALSTLNELSVFTIQETNSIEDADWLIWLSDDEPAKTPKLIVIDNSSLKEWSVINHTQIRISSDWTMQKAIEMNLPKKLVHLFGDGALDNSKDLRTMDISTFSYQITENNEFKEVEESAVNYFWILLIVGLVVERWLSFKSEKQ